MNETIGAVIRRLRKEKSFTQEELAEQLGVTAQAVSKWENETGMPDISQIVPLATVFGVSTDVLFGRAGVSDKEDIEARLAVIFRYSDAVDGNEAAEGLKILDMYRNLLKDYPSNPTILLNAAQVMTQTVPSAAAGRSSRNSARSTARAAVIPSKMVRRRAGRRAEEALFPFRFTSILIQFILYRERWQKSRDVLGFSELLPERWD